MIIEKIFRLLHCSLFNEGVTLLRALILISLIASITACAATPEKKPCQLKQENKAIVLGAELNILMEPIHRMNPIEYTKLYCLTIDGQNCPPDTIELTPGSHSFDFSCSWKQGSYVHLHQISNYQIDVEPGHIYHLSAWASSDRCTVKHEDTTFAWGSLDKCEVKPNITRGQQLGGQ